MVATHSLTLATWACLGLSAALLQLAPLWMPAGYSAWAHSISESAAQGLPHAAWARLGLALLGVGAALTAAQAWAGQRLPKAAAACLWVFGVAMLASAVWSHRPWWPGAVFDARADRLHSIAAQVAGVAFLAAIAMRMVQTWHMQRHIDALDAAAALAAVLAPLAMLVSAPAPGAAQRVMFALASVWLVRCARA